LISFTTLLARLGRAAKPVPSGCHADADDRDRLPLRG
jgi:hypothetical protein